MRKILLILSILNLLDGFLTWLGYINNLILELNPLMNIMLETNHWHFLVFKVFVSGVLLGLGVFLSKRTISNWVLWSFRAILVIYIGLILMHFGWITIFLLWYFGYY